MLTLVPAMVATAQSSESGAAPADTIMEKNLTEVVVEAPKIIHKTDMDLYIPSKSAVENSKNGLQLLANLAIPAMNVNNIMEKVTAAGEEVQLRINGRQATVEQVKAIMPENIRRVEWIDNPGLHYNGAAYVVNFVVINPTLGGAVMAEALAAVNTVWAKEYLTLQLNSGRSQWEAGVYSRLAEKTKIHRDYTETFTYPDGSHLTRKEKPIGGEANTSASTPWLSYCYIKPDTTTFYANFNTGFAFSNSLTYEGLLTLNNGSDDILLHDTNGKPRKTPSLSLYLEHNLPHRQMIVADFGASYYMGHTYSDYVEKDAVTAQTITDVHTFIRDRNQAYALEANYIKKWNSSRLTLGTGYTANRNRSVYDNLDGSIFHQRQDRLHFFAEYYLSVRKLTVTAGLGVYYMDYRFRETDQGDRSWNLRPRATLLYRLSNNHRLRLTFNSWQTAPSLTETNIAPQQTDGFQWTIGNPELKPSRSYRLALQYNFNLPRVNGSLRVTGFTSPGAITPYMYWDENRLVTSYENSRGFQQITTMLAPQVEIIPNHLSLNGYLEYRAERMRGTGYSIYNHNWSGSVGLQASYKKWSLYADYRRASRDLWGEKISWGEDYSTIALVYNLPNWHFTAGMFMPFGTYDQGSRRLNRYNTNEQHMRLDMRMPFISVNYNIRWGHQKKGARKLINADASATGSAAATR